MAYPGVSNIISLKDFKIESDYHARSLLLGTVPPEKECSCCFGYYPSAKVETPSLIELDLSAREHRLRSMRTVQKDFFTNLIHKTTEYEKDMIELFGLPDIEDIRRSIQGEQVPEGRPFELPPAKVKGYKRILGEWKKDLIGGEASIKEASPEDVAICSTFACQSFNIGIDKTWSDILDELPDAVDPEDFAKYKIVPSFDDMYSQGFYKRLEKRVFDRLSGPYLDEVLKELRSMTKEGVSSLRAGRFLHKAVGEGQSWYWLRFSRSESVLSMNSAFDIQSRASGVRYEQWSSAANACPICSALNGHVWILGEGPQPVSSTHPHCLCVRVPKFNTEKPVQPAWAEPSPYEQRFTADDVLRIRENLRRAA